MPTGSGFNTILLKVIDPWAKRSNLTSVECCKSTQPWHARRVGHLKVTAGNNNLPQLSDSVVWECNWYGTGIHHVIALSISAVICILCSGINVTMEHPKKPLKPRIGSRNHCGLEWASAMLVCELLLIWSQNTLIIMLQLKTKFNGTEPEARGWGLY